MRTITKTKNRQIKEYTYLEFIDRAENRKDKSGGRLSSRKTGSDRERFSGSKTFAEAVKYARNGWSSGIEQLDEEDGIEIESSIEIENSVVGSFVNIGNYIQGLPDNMYQMTDSRNFDRPEVTIYCDLACVVGVKVSHGKKFTQSIIEAVNKLQTIYDIRIIGFFNMTSGGVHHTDLVTIKDFGERMVLNAIAYSFNISFFRRLYFSVYEGEDYFYWGYGRHNRKNHEDIKPLADENSFITPSLNKTFRNGGGFKFTDLVKLTDFDHEVNLKEW